MRNPPSKLPDEEFVLRARAGEVRAFDRLVERYFAMVYSIAYIRMRNRETAKDLAQEVFLRAFLHLDAIRDPKRFSAWLCEVTRNLAFRWQREQRRYSSLIATVPIEELKMEVADHQTKEASEQMECRETTQFVRQALFQLPAEEAEIVLLRFGEDIKPPEIARRLELHPTTVRRRLKKALTAMKMKLPSLLEEVTPLISQSREQAIRTIRLIDAVAVLSPQQVSDLGMLSAGSSEKGVWGTGMPLRSFYYWAYQTTPGRVIMPSRLADRVFNITLEVSEPDFRALYPAMQELLAGETGLTARWEVREMNVYVLSAPCPERTELRPPGPLPNGWRSFMRLDSTLGSECRNAHLVDMVIHLEENLCFPVVDETGLSGQYDWDIQWDKGASANQIIEAVRAIGLELVPERRRLEMLVLEEHIPAYA